MKPKNLSKKLKLSKVTIVQLNKGKINNVYGGKNAPPKPASLIVPTCEPNCGTVTGDPCIAC
jgi:hypothetical protein